MPVPPEDIASIAVSELTRLASDGISRMKTKTPTFNEATLTPKKFGNRWEVTAELGKGGQGLTHVVRDTFNDGNKRYVLKELIDPKKVERFKREIEAVKSLNHPNVVSLVDYNIEVPEPYLVMEYCEGGALSTAKPFWDGDVQKALKVFLEICEGVKAAHAAKIIHRDLKPENIFLRTPDGPAVVGDFGICFIDDGERLTITEEVVGPRNYRPPEIEDGKADEISARTDIYSLGKVLYWLLSGRSFSREKHRDLKYDLKGHVPDSQIGWKNVYMEHINLILDEMITHDPEERFTEITTVISRIEKAASLISRGFNVLAPGLAQVCNYCGQGKYKLHVEDVAKAGYFGLNPVGGHDWRILACMRCGHVEMFRLDFASHRDLFGPYTAIGLNPSQHDVENTEEFDDNDILINLREYMLDAEVTTGPYYFARVDKELHLPSGSTERLIEKAALDLDLVEDARGRTAVKFKRKPTVRRRNDGSGY